MTEPTFDLVIIYDESPKSKHNTIHRKVYESYAEQHNFNLKEVVGPRRFLEQHKEKNPSLPCAFFDVHGAACGDYPVIALVTFDGRVLASQSAPYDFHNLGVHMAVKSETV